MLSARRPGAAEAAVGVVALALLAGLLAPAAAAAASAAPAPCDADGDGRATGVPGVVFSDGDDEAAARLRAGSGTRLPPAEPGRRWRVPVCTEEAAGPGPAAPRQVVSVTGPPVAELSPQAPAWQPGALAAALDRLTPRLYRPGARTSPPVNGVQVVGVEMWLAVDRAAWVAVTERASDGEVTVTATATPRRTVWEFTDGVVRTCDGPGVEYTAGARGPAPCGRGFEATTDVRPVTASVSIDYLVTWSSTIGGSGAVGRRGEPNRYELVVGEVQTYLTDGSRPPPPAPAALPLPESSRPVDDASCAWRTFWDCSPAQLAGAVTGLAGDVALAALPAPVQQALGALWSFLEGCAAFVGEVAASAKEVFAQFGGLVSDPGGFVRDKLDVATTMFAAVRLDPAAFAAEFLGQAIDADLLRRDAATWAGKIGCELALAVLTGGAAASRLAGVLGDVDRVRQWVQRRNGDGRDGAGAGATVAGSCRANSFVPGTAVLMADGTVEEIEDVRRGERVWATDPVTGTTSGRPVVDTIVGHGAKRLVDVVVAGGAVTATAPTRSG